jgi:hypothetical protein
MKSKAQMATLILIAINAAIAVYFLLRPAPTPTFNSAKLTGAVIAFARDQGAKGVAPANTVSLRQLLNGGYLQSNDVRAFDGIDLVLNINASETDPNSILAQAKMPDGMSMVVLGDGSIQQMTPEALRLKLAAAGTNAPPR